MEYRKAVENDKEGIAKVLVDAYNIDNVMEAEEVFLNEAAKQYNYVVAVEGGIIVGLVTWQMHGLPKHGLCELDRIAVLPDFRGKGIAKGLFNALLSEAGKAYVAKGFRLRKLYILTHASNKRAQSFYEKMGCRHEATLKSHYYDKEDEFVYSMFL